MSKKSGQFRTSSLRAWGWPTMAAGVLLAVVGVIVILVQTNEYRPDAGWITLGGLLVGGGISTGNIGFFLLMFGIIEDRIYEAQGITRNGMQWLGEKVGQAGPSHD